jgi:hypothetical protein
MHSRIFIKPDPGLFSLMVIVSKRDIEQLHQDPIERHSQQKSLTQRLLRLEYHPFGPVQFGKTQLRLDEQIARTLCTGPTSFNATTKYQDPLVPEKGTMEISGSAECSGRQQGIIITTGYIMGTFKFLDKPGQEFAPTQFPGQKYGSASDIIPVRSQAQQLCIVR